MKTTAALVALMAAGAVAQPHNHARHAHPQHHRDLEERGYGSTKTDWVTEWVTKYVTVDGPVPQQTEAAEESLNASPGNFKDRTSSTEEPVVEETSTSTTPTSTPEPEPTSEEPEPTTEVPSPEETTPTTTYTPPEETTTKEPEPTTTTDSGNGGGGGGGESHSGFITYYDIGLGACGFTDTVGGSGTFDNPMVVAISKNIFFDGLANPNSMELCNKKILIQSSDAPGVKAYGLIRDACEACTTIGDIDVNIEGMQNFYPNAVAVGKGSITWSLV